MREHNGIASLELLYQQAGHHRSPLPSGDWRKTLRGVLYREVRRGRFVKVGLGVYALPQLHFNTRFVLVAPEKRQALFQQRLNQEPFREVQKRFAFRSFEQVARFYFNCVEHFELRTQFLGD